MYFDIFHLSELLQLNTKLIYFWYTIELLTSSTLKYWKCCIGINNIENKINIKFKTICDSFILKHISYKLFQLQSHICFIQLHVVLHTSKLK